MTNDELMEQSAGILFSGFWEGGNGGNFKAPFSNRTERPFEKAKAWRYVCGHLKPHVRMIDFDSNFNAAVQIAKDNEEHCIAIKSPGGSDRGHIYYFDHQQRLLVSNTKMKTVLTLFPIDYKCGQKAVKSTGEVKTADSAGALSKPDGTFRDIVYFNPKEDQTLDEVPFYHLPMKSGTKHDFMGMKEGDGRQDGLFTYMAPMKSAGYSYDEYLTAAKLINEYVFATPMGTDELANATRREAWETLSATKESDFFDGRSFRHDKMGDYLLQNNSLKKINGQLQFYQNGAYTAATEPLLKMMVKLVPRLTDRQRNEVLKYLNLSADEAFADTGYIGFKNGLYDVSTGVLIPHSSSIITTNMIPWNYNPDAYSELLDKTLDKLTCNDPEIRSLLEELGGSCLYSGSPMLAGGKAFILTGDKANGKSTFINMLEDLLGELNYSSLGLNFLGTRFHTAELFGKLANLGNDISDTYIEDTATFKQVVTGDTIETERKGKDPFSFKPYCTLVFSANDIPRTKDRTGAVLRRLVIIPFNATFSKDDPDFNPHIREDLKSQECIESSHTSISNIAATLNVYGETCKRASELWNTVRRDIEANYIGNLKTAKITDAKKVYDDTVAKAKEEGYAQCISELDNIRAKCKEVASMPVPDDFTVTLKAMKTIKNPSENERTMILDKYKGNYLAYRAALNVLSPKAPITTLDDVLGMCDTLQAFIQKAFNSPISDYNFRMLTNEGYMANYDAAFTAFTTCRFDAISPT